MGPYLIPSNGTFKLPQTWNQLRVLLLFRYNRIYLKYDVPASVLDSDYFRDNLVLSVYCIPPDSYAISKMRQHVVDKILWWGPLTISSGTDILILEAFVEGETPWDFVSTRSLLFSP